jgi:hypothetical protein
MVNDNDVVPEQGIFEKTQVDIPVVEDPEPKHKAVLSPFLFLKVKICPRWNQMKSC